MCGSQQKNEKHFFFLEKYDKIMHGEIRRKDQMKKINNTKEVLYSIFFPRRCPICDETIVYEKDICEECGKELTYITEPSCKKCGKQVTDERSEYCPDCSRKRHYYKQGKAIFAYQKGMKRSMYRFKYSGRKEYASFYARTAKERIGHWVMRHGIEVIVPIPMYRRKQRMRGYNQAEVFAKSLGDYLDLPVDTKLVRRIKNTVPQKELNDIQRKDNLKGAFQLQTNIVKYRKILLVDDIYTTGSTVDAVAKCFLETGIEEVYFLTVCIGEGC